MRVVALILLVAETQGKLPTILIGNKLMSVQVQTVVHVYVYVHCLANSL